MKLLPPPGPARNQQLVLFGIAVVLLAGVLWYMQGPQAIPAAASSNSAAPAVPALQTLKLPEPLKLATLEAVPDRSEVGRNPFGFGARPAPPAPPVSLPPPRPAPPPAPVLPPVPQGPPPIALKLIGLMQHEGRSRVILKDPASGAVYQGFEGDVVDGRFRVIKIGLQSVVVSYVDGSGQRTIPIGG